MTTLFFFSIRFAVPLVTRSTLEVVIPNSAVASLSMRAGSKLAQISEVLYILIFFS
jgi:poly(rC)-binding protein 2/3/4